jgi:UDP-glucose 4-epimerase
MKKALVTGGNGFIGSHLVDRLLKSEEYDKVMVIDPRGHVYNDPRVEHRSYKVQDYLSVSFPFDISVVFHLAGHVGPVGVLDSAGQIVKDTVDMADLVSTLASVNSCPLVFTSTSEVYGSPDAANKESDALVFPAASSARREYAIGKLAAEALFIERKQGVMIRPFNVAGPRQRAEGGFVLPRFIQQALRNENLTVYEPGTQRRTFTHVADIVDGLILAANIGKPGSVYNLGNDSNVIDMISLAQRVLDITGSKLSPGIEIVDPKELHGPTFREAAEKTADSQKARTELGWRPSRDTNRIIEDTVWYWQQSNR